MASETNAMTPEDAIATLDTVRGYREALNARAAGLLWMVWGLVWAAVGSLGSSSLALVGSVGMPVATTAGAGAGILGDVVLLAGGVVVSNVVWRTLALQRDDEHRPGATWLTAAVFAVVAVAAGTLAIAAVLKTDLGPWGSVILATSVAPAAAAAVMAVILRARVPVGPGLLAAGGLLLAQGTMSYLTVLARQEVETAASTASLEMWVAVAGIVQGLEPAVTLVGYGAAGLWYFRRG